MRAEPPRRVRAARACRALALAGLLACAFLRPAGAAMPLDCDDVAADALRGLQAPRVILVKGTLPQLTLDSLARFLIAMGYPAARIADPRDGSLSQSGYEDSAKLAGEVAWYDEHDGAPPILIGHSRGGMLVIRTLHELAGAFHRSIPVWDPVQDRALARTTIVDPHDGTTRPVVGGVEVDYAVAIATGKLPRIWQGQWDMLRRLREIPDTARDFTGFHIEGDLISGDAFGIEPYAAMHAAHVRNVVLPSSYSHIGAVDLAHLGEEAALRAFVDAWRPGSTATPPAGDTRNLGLAVELWYGVKRSWCRAAMHGTTMHGTAPGPRLRGDDTTPDSRLPGDGVRR